MAKVTGRKRIVAALEKRRKKFEELPEVFVGYSAHYALYVHECVEMKLAGKLRPSGLGRYWSPLGRAQAKFLEQPAREMANQLRDMIAESLIKGMPLEKAFYQAGLALQRASQRLVPVETGNLKASAFTEVR